MAAYCWVYDSRHLQADCQESGSAPEPALVNQVWATFLPLSKTTLPALHYPSKIYAGYTGAVPKRVTLNISIISQRHKQMDSQIDGKTPD